MLRYERRADLGEKVKDYSVGMTRVCIGISCPLGQTCVRGKCEIASYADDPLVCGTGAPPADGAVDTSDQPVCPDQDAGGIP